MKSTQYYDNLIEQKNNGTLLSFNTITEEQLKQLWYKESVPDSGIADLFNVKKSQVTYRRKQFDMTLRKCILEDFFSVGYGSSHIESIVK